MSGGMEGTPCAAPRLTAVKSPGLPRGDLGRFGNHDGADADAHSLSQTEPTMIQWHPLFAQLLRPLLEGYYAVETNVPVGDVPRAPDIVLVRRPSGEPPPFKGLWKDLTPWNVFEYKGPT